MTIASSVRKAGPFTGNDTTTVFPFAFKVFSSADVYVVKLDVATDIEEVLTLTTDYTVSLNADQNTNPGGSVTLPAVLATGYKLTITSDLDYLQPADITNQGGFYPGVIGNALDRLTIFAQQLNESISRTLKLAVSTESGVETTLPAPAASKLIGWNSAGDNLQNYDAATFATLAAYGTSHADMFNGDGTTVAFALTENPAAINNLDVSISGVTQRPGIDYSWTAGTTITFNAAPPVGTNNILVRYMQGLPQELINADLSSTSDVSKGAALVGQSVQVVNGVATLRTIAPAATRFIRTRYHTNAGDGGHGDWRPVTGAAPGTYVDNNGTIIVPTGGDGSAAWLRDYSGYVDIRWFGAVTTSTSNETFIQAAVDAVKSANETTPLTKSRYVLVPNGDFQISAPINLYSGVMLIGEGQNSKIKASGTFFGTALILLKGQGAGTYFEFGGYNNLGFECAGSVWAVKAFAADVINCIFSEGWFNCGYCLDLGTYAQSCLIDGMYSYGPVDQLLHLKGNHNIIRRLDKEGNTGSSVDPYVLIENHALGISTGNVIKSSLIEGTTSVNKPLVKMVGCAKCEIDDIWLEPTLTNGFGIHLDTCFGIRLSKLNGHLLTSTKIKLVTSHNISLDFASANDSDYKFSDVFDIDATSDIQIDEYYSRRGADLYMLANLDRNVTIGKHYSETSASIANVSPLNEFMWVAGQNLALNGSFEAGRYGWSFSTNPTTTEEYITSEVGSGLMGHFVWAAQAFHTLTQNITVPANVPVTITVLAKAIAGAGGWISPLIQNLGITASNGLQRTYVGSGWAVLTLTAIPTSAGVLNVGIINNNCTEISVDEFSISIGTVSVPNIAKFGSLEVSGKTYLSASAAPATGTWKVGDYVKNSAPAVGQPKGWYCTVAGSPGTWVSEGNL